VDDSYSNRITHVLCEHQKSDVFQLVQYAIVVFIQLSVVCLTWTTHLTNLAGRNALAVHVYQPISPGLV